MQTIAATATATPCATRPAVFSSDFKGSVQITSATGTTFFKRAVRLDDVDVAMTGDCAWDPETRTHSAAYDDASGVMHWLTRSGRRVAAPAEDRMSRVTVRFTDGTVRS